MTRVSLTDPFVPPGVLLDKLRARNCVAFVGAGFSLPIGMPTWGGLLHLLVERARSLGREALQLTQCVECIDEKDFIVAASILRRMLNRAEILDVIGSAFSMQHYQTANADKRVRMDERIRSLVRAPWQGVVTTNFDELIEVGYQKWTPNPPQFALDFETQLGTILSRRKEGGSFFVKIHGSVGLSKIILNPQEYDAAYYTENKIRNLLNAVMLSSTLVFIGCSLEDTLLSIRKQICADHGGHIPTAFALLPCTPSNLRRSDWLREDLRIEPIIYPIANDHLAVDEFLVCCGNLVERI